MDAYVSKPIRVDELVAAIASCGFGAGQVVGAPLEPESPVLDQQALENARALPGSTGASLLPELVGMYLGDELEHLDRIGRLIDARQSQEAADEAHAFGGNAASFGGVGVRQIALRVEREVRAGKWEDAAASMQELRHGCARLREELARLGLADE